MFVYVSILVAIVGLLLVFLSDKPKANTVGYIAFGCGLLAFLLKPAEKLVDLLGK